ncbi:MAG: signal peptidase II [Acutalibacteraceae bacterium]
MITVWCSLIIAIILLLIDQCTKIVVMNYMYVGDKIPVIKGFFSLEYVQNKGAAFGMMQNFRYVFVILALCVIILVVFAMLKGKIKNKYLIWAFALIISGGAGNTIDRLFHSGGYVVDFLKFELSWFPYVFNFADICVTFGGVILFVYLIADIIGSKKAKRLVSEKELNLSEKAMLNNDD